MKGYSHTLSEVVDIQNLMPSKIKKVLEAGEKHKVWNGVIKEKSNIRKLLAR